MRKYFLIVLGLAFITLPVIAIGQEVEVTPETRFDFVEKDNLILERLVASTTLSEVEVVELFYKEKQTDQLLEVLYKIEGHLRDIKRKI